LDCAVISDEARLFKNVILSGIGAYATMKSKDREDVYCNEGASGNFLETKIESSSRIPVNERAQSSARE
jgi:hypothetical protein